MAPMAADTAHKHISLDGNISGLASASDGPLLDANAKCGK